MNTLTHFIDAQFSIKNQLTTQENESVNGADSNAQYEVIENETLNSSNLKGLAISGSLFSLTTFTNVTFESCVFYASKLENCTFINCTFKDCKFEFTQVQHCRFNNCTMEDTQFSYSPVKRSNFAFCDLDHKALHYIDSEVNQFHECGEASPVTWEEIMDDQTSLAQGQSVQKENVAKDATGALAINIADAMEQVLAKLKVA